jgi:hypothetical protein
MSVKTKVGLVLIFLVPLLMYGTISFVNLSPNVESWAADDRIILAAFISISVFFGTIILITKVDL